VVRLGKVWIRESAQTITADYRMGGRRKVE